MEMVDNNGRRHRIDAEKTIDRNSQMTFHCFGWMEGPSLIKNDY